MDEDPPAELDRRDAAAKAYREAATDLGVSLAGAELRERLLQVRERQVERGRHPDYRPDGSPRRLVVVEPVPACLGYCSAGWLALTEPDALARVPDPDPPFDASEHEVERYASEWAHVESERRAMLDSWIPCKVCQEDRYEAWVEGKFHGGARRGTAFPQRSRAPKAERPAERERRDLE